METKIVNITIHERNYKRRVKYNDRKEFDTLIVNLQDAGKNRSFQIDSKYLPDNDSIHLIYDPITHAVRWSPKEIAAYITEI